MPGYGIQLKIARVKHRLTQKDFADLIGIRPSTVMEIEKGRVGIDRDTFKRMKNAIEDNTEHSSN